VERQRFNRDEIIAVLREHEAELRAAGVAGLSLVGSAARGQQQANSDVDVLVRFDQEADIKGLAYFGRMDQLTNRLEAILNRPVDLIAEPVRKERLRRELEKDRAVAF
jgi:predicted nucleotidyltransferase